MSKTVHVTIEVKNNAGTVLTTYTETMDMSLTGQDLEYEQVVDGGGAPLVRPKQAPKY